MGMVDLDVYILSHLKEELAWAVDKQLCIISTIMFLNSNSTKELKGIEEYSLFKFKTILLVLLCGPW